MVMARPCLWLHSDMIFTISGGLRALFLFLTFFFPCVSRPPIHLASEFFFLSYSLPSSVFFPSRFPFLLHGISPMLRFSL